MGNFLIEFKKSGKHAGIQILFINPWRLIKTMNRCQEGLLLVGKLKDNNKKATKDSSSNNNKTRINNNNKITPTLKIMVCFFLYKLLTLLEEEKIDHRPQQQ